MFLTYFPQAVLLHYSAPAQKNTRFVLHWDRSVDEVIAGVGKESLASIRVYQWDRRRREFLLRLRNGRATAPHG